MTSNLLSLGFIFLFKILNNSVHVISSFSLGCGSSFGVSGSKRAMSSSILEPLLVLNCGFARRYFRLFSTSSSSVKLFITS